MKMICLTLLVATTVLADTPTEKPFHYHPVNTTFWEAVDKATKDKQFEHLIDIADEQAQVTKQGTLERNEAKLATGLALQGLNLTYGATRLFEEILKESVGTDVASRALVSVENIGRTLPVDEDLVFGEIATDMELEGLSPEIQDFISFQNALFNEAHGYSKWTAAELKKIHENSPWDYRVRYYRAIEEVEHNKLDTALEKFTKLSEDAAAPDEIKTAAAHQQARLLFEKADYDNAYKLFKKVKLNPRERGVILLERAWSKYYQKDYGKALGLLYALESPYFDTSRTPEPYILKMVIYKELCHYKAALGIVGEFNKRFKGSLALIHARGDLRNDPGLVNMAVLDQNAEKWVNFLNQIKEERTNLDKYNWDHLELVKNIKRAYDLEIQKIRSKLALILQDKIRTVADQLLDWQEQITFLEYQTRFDSLRVGKPSGEAPYKPEEVPHINFDETYWQRNGEFWFDELEDFKVLISSQCDEKSPQ